MTGEGMDRFGHFFPVLGAWSARGVNRFYLRDVPTVTH